MNERTSAPTEGVVAAFKVRHATMHVDVEGQEEGWTKLVGVSVEAEPVFHYPQCESHRKLCERYHVWSIIARRLGRSASPPDASVSTTGSPTRRAPGPSAAIPARMASVCCRTDWNPLVHQVALAHLAH